LSNNLETLVEALEAQPTREPPLEDHNRWNLETCDVIDMPIVYRHPWVHLG